MSLYTNNPRQSCKIRPAYSTIMGANIGTSVTA